MVCCGVLAVVAEELPMVEDALVAAEVVAVEELGVVEALAVVVEPPDEVPDADVPADAVPDVEAPAIPAANC